MLREDFSQAFGADLLREHVREDGDRHGHTLVVGAEHRVEERGVLESAVLLHLGEVLVRECKRVRGRGHDGLRFARLVREVRFVLVFGDEFLAAAGISRDAVGGEVRALRQDACGDQRIYAQDETGSVAAGVRDALALRDGLALGGRKFGHPVGPVGVHAVRGGGVDDARVRIIAEGGAFDGRRVGQAQERHVGLVDEPLAFVQVLAEFGRNAQHFDVAALCESLINLQACCTCFAIYENFEHLSID